MPIGSTSGNCTEERLDAAPRCFTSARIQLAGPRPTRHKLIQGAASSLARLSDPHNLAVGSILHAKALSMSQQRPTANRRNGFANRRGDRQCASHRGVNAPCKTQNKHQRQSERQLAAPTARNEPLARAQNGVPGMQIGSGCASAVPSYASRHKAALRARRRKMKGGDSVSMGAGDKVRPSHAIERILASQWPRCSAFKAVCGVKEGGVRPASTPRL